tara:strand:- start:440 stop:691 length:252 start_codon:yes stop_codon:yes gene_type:complete
MIKLTEHGGNADLGNQGLPEGVEGPKRETQSRAFQALNIGTDVAGRAVSGLTELGRTAAPHAGRGIRNVIGGTAGFIKGLFKY